MFMYKMKWLNKKRIVLHWIDEKREISSAFLSVFSGETESRK